MALEADAGHAADASLSARSRGSALPQVEPEGDFLAQGWKPAPQGPPEATEVASVPPRISLDQK